MPFTIAPGGGGATFAITPLQPFMAAASSISTLLPVRNMGWPVPWRRTAPPPAAKPLSGEARRLGPQIGQVTASRLGVNYIRQRMQESAAQVAALKPKVMANMALRLKRAAIDDLPLQREYDALLVKVGELVQARPLVVEENTLAIEGLRNATAIPLVRPSLPSDITATPQELQTLQEQHAAARTRAIEAATTRHKAALDAQSSLQSQGEALTEKLRALEPRVAAERKAFSLRPIMTLMSRTNRQLAGIGDSRRSTQLVLEALLLSMYRDSEITEPAMVTLTHNEGRSITLPLHVYLTNDRYVNERPHDTLMQVRGARETNFNVALPGLSDVIDDPEFRRCYQDAGGTVTRSAVATSQSLVPVEVPRHLTDLGAFIDWRLNQLATQYNLSAADALTLHRNMQLTIEHYFQKPPPDAETLVVRTTRTTFAAYLLDPRKGRDSILMARPRFPTSLQKAGYTRIRDALRHMSLYHEYKAAWLTFFSQETVASALKNSLGYQMDALLLHFIIEQEDKGQSAYVDLAKRALNGEVQLRCVKGRREYQLETFDRLFALALDERHALIFSLKDHNYRVVQWNSQYGNLGSADEVAWLASHLYSGSSLRRALRPAGTHGIVTGHPVSFAPASDLRELLFNVWKQRLLDEVDAQTTTTAELVARRLAQLTKLAFQLAGVAMIFVAPAVAPLMQLGAFAATKVQAELADDAEDRHRLDTDAQLGAWSALLGFTGLRLRFTDVQHGVRTVQANVAPLDTFMTLIRNARWLKTLLNQPASTRFNTLWRIPVRHPRQAEGSAARFQHILQETASSSTSPSSSRYFIRSADAYYPVAWDPIGEVWRIVARGQPEPHIWGEPVTHQENGDWVVGQWRPPAPTLPATLNTTADTDALAQITRLGPKASRQAVFTLEALAREIDLQSSSWLAWLHHEHATEGFLGTSPCEVTSMEALQHLAGGIRMAITAATTDTEASIGLPPMLLALRSLGTGLAATGNGTTAWHRVALNTLLAPAGQGFQFADGRQVRLFVPSTAATALPTGRTRQRRSAPIATDTQGQSDASDDGPATGTTSAAHGLGQEAWSPHPVKDRVDAALAELDQLQEQDDALFTELDQAMTALHRHEREQGAPVPMNEACAEDTACSISSIRSTVDARIARVEEAKTTCAAIRRRQAELQSRIDVLRQHIHAQQPALERESIALKLDPIRHALARVAHRMRKAGFDAAVIRGAMEETLAALYQPANATATINVRLSTSSMGQALVIPVREFLTDDVYVDVSPPPYALTIVGAGDESPRMLAPRLTELLCDPVFRDIYQAAGAVPANDTGQTAGAMAIPATLLSINDFIDHYVQGLASGHAAWAGITGDAMVEVRYYAPDTALEITLKDRASVPLRDVLRDPFSVAKSGHTDEIHYPPPLNTAPFAPLRRMVESRGLFEAYKAHWSDFFNQDTVGDQLVADWEQRIVRLLIEYVATQGLLHPDGYSRDIVEVLNGQRPLHVLMERAHPNGVVFDRLFAVARTDNQALIFSLRDGSHRAVHWTSQYGRLGSADEVQWLKSHLSKRAPLQASLWPLHQQGRVIARPIAFVVPRAALAPRLLRAMKERLLDDANAMTVTSLEHWVRAFATLIKEAADITATPLSVLKPGLASIVLRSVSAAASHVLAEFEDNPQTGTRHFNDAHTAAMIQLLKLGGKMPVGGQPLLPKVRVPGVPRELSVGTLATVAAEVRRYARFGMERAQGQPDKRWSIPTPDARLGPYPPHPNAGILVAANEETTAATPTLYIRESQRLYRVRCEEACAHTVILDPACTDDAAYGLPVTRDAQGHWRLKAVTSDVDYEGHRQKVVDVVPWLARDATSIARLSAHRHGWDAVYALEVMTRQTSRARANYLSMVTHAHSQRLFLGPAPVEVTTSDQARQIRAGSRIAVVDVPDDPEGRPALLACAKSLESGRVALSQGQALGLGAGWTTALLTTLLRFQGGSCYVENRRVRLLVETPAHPATT